MSLGRGQQLGSKSTFRVYRLPRVPTHTPRPPLSGLGGLLIGPLPHPVSHSSQTAAALCLVLLELPITLRIK